MQTTGSHNGAVCSQPAATVRKIERDGEGRGEGREGPPSGVISMDHRRLCAQHQAGRAPVQTARGKVALKRTVWRLGCTFSMMRVTCGVKPMSNMRSASSSTTKDMRFRLVTPAGVQRRKSEWREKSGNGEKATKQMASLDAHMCHKSPNWFCSAESSPIHMSGSQAALSVRALIAQTSLLPTPPESRPQAQTSGVCAEEIDHAARCAHHDLCATLQLGNLLGDARPSVCTHKLHARRVNGCD